MVQVSATDLHTEVSMKVRVEGAAVPEQEAAQRALAESEKQSADDRRRRTEIEAAIYAENLLLAARQLIEQAGRGGGEHVRQLAQAVEIAAAALQDALAEADPVQIQASTPTLESLLDKLSRQIKADSARAGGTQTAGARKPKN